MRSSSSPGFDLREAVDSLRATFAPLTTTRTRTDADVGGGERRDVRSAILRELVDEPMHGYQIIRAIETRSGGAWKPSPGSVYPTLQLLDDEGLALAAQVGERRVYSLTEAGRQAAAMAADSESAPEHGEPRRSRGVNGRIALTKSGVTLLQALTQVAQSGTHEQSERATAIVDEARRQLYAILAEG
jgi:DNA-binding PadR family transcriptional regulator